MPSLTIGNVTAQLPIIQGGMAVRISLSPLAGAVAGAGGVGVIAGTGLELDELAAELKNARRLAGNGVIGVNVMVAVRNFKDLVQTALANGADLIIAGAGFSRDVFGWCKEAGVPMVPIVGSVRVAQLSQKFGASAVIVEGYEAGGHLGTDRMMRDLLPEIIESVDIPVIGAGGVVTGADIKEVLEMGASGVQMGSRFAATVESSAPDGFKKMYVEATPDDIVIVRSPVGLPGRAIRNRFVEKSLAGEHPRITGCINCLKECNKDYCIMDKLVGMQQGDVVEGLVFAGSAAARVHDVPHAADLVERLKAEYSEACEGAA